MTAADLLKGALAAEDAQAYFAEHARDNPAAFFDLLALVATDDETGEFAELVELVQEQLNRKRETPK